MNLFIFVVAAGGLIVMVFIIARLRPRTDSSEMLPIIKPVHPLIAFITWIPRAYSEVFRKANPVPAEMMFAGISTLWGTWLLFPWWDTFSSSPSFVMMGKLAPEPVWGLALVIGGIGHYLALYRNSLLWRYRASLYGYFLWAFITLTFMYANLRATSTPIYGTVAFGLLIMTVRLRRELKWMSTPSSPHS